MSFSDLLMNISECSRAISEQGIQSGDVVALEADFSPNGIALFLSLVEKACLLVVHTNAHHIGREKKDEIAQVEWNVVCDKEDNYKFEKTRRKAQHDIYTHLKDLKHPGLVLFSSGTSGEPKAAVHDFLPLLEKFKVPKKAMVSLNFLLFDHWGGLNTMLHTLSNGAALVSLQDRSPESVCELIQSAKVQLLPSTPTFLNLMLLSEAHKKYDLSSLQVISYGAEPMPEKTLSRLKEAFPHIKLQQTYGLIEVGVLRSKSKENGSLWVKIGGEGYETRVVDNILQIKTKSTILGYLNALSPITEDGWFITGDEVYQEGEYFRILGRKSEMINIGGEKLHPSEVESVILQLNNVVDVTVFSEKNPILGRLLCANVKLQEPEDPREFSDRLKEFCADRLDRFKIPVKIKLIDGELHGDRFKKIRSF
ncbi:MAG: fatty acid--CoA ligase family protein [Bdellovibrionales bacterium]